MDNRLRVELVSNSPPGQISGIGRYASELFSHLQGQVDVRLTGVVDPPMSGRFSILHNFPLGIRDHQPGSIVHFTQIMGAAVMVWRPQRPAVATVHDLGVLVCSEDEALFSSLDRKVLDLHLAGLKQMDAIIADSEFTRQSIINHFNLSAERVVVIHLGVDHERFKPIPGARIKLESKYSALADRASPWLLYVGSELPRKNLSTLLEAFSIIRKTFPKALLLKVGDAGGAQFRKITSAAVEALDLEQSVLFLDRLPEEDLPLFYNAADLLVMTSLLEGFGLPVLEAMACGTPVVCSDAGSLSEVTGGAAMLVDPMDAVQFANAAASILEDTAVREQFRQKGLTQSRRFSWPDAAEQTMAVYLNAAISSRSVRAP